MRDVAQGPEHEEAASRRVDMRPPAGGPGEGVADAGAARVRSGIFAWRSRLTAAAPCPSSVYVAAQPNSSGPL